MKIAILFGAALLGTAGVAAAPAEAQRHGWNDRHDRGWNGDRRWRDDRGRPGWHDGRRGFRNDGWNRGRGDGRGWGRDRSRIACRTYNSYYGPERRCVRIRR